MIGTSVSLAVPVQRLERLTRLLDHSSDKEDCVSGWAQGNLFTYGLSTAMILVAHPPIENSDAVAETQSMAWSVICGARHACNNRRRHILQ